MPSAVRRSLAVVSACVAALGMLGMPAAAASARPLDAGGAGASQGSAVPGVAGSAATTTMAIAQGGAGKTRQIVGADSVSPGVANFPPRDSGYHNYPEMVAHIHAVAAAHPGIVRLYDLGTSYQGRIIWAAQVSDNLDDTQLRPEVLFDGLTHAREHLSGEMTLYILDLLADNFGGTDAVGTQVTQIVETRRIWIIFQINPDGGQYDLTGHPFRAWRKNRQPNPGSPYVGTDINRNYGYDWGCCGGSSGNTSSINYRGPHAWSTPEARVVRAFVLSRIKDGVQQIRTHITFHTHGELILWPYGHTYAKVPKDMTRVDHQVLVAMGKHMAATNGYTPEQSSSLYITDGDMDDWLYGTQRIFTYTFEMYPDSAEVAQGVSEWYPDDSVIAKQTARNRDAVLYLMQMADCPYRAIGEAATYCGPFFDDLEISRGWTLNPKGNDTATDGRWARGVPQSSTYQLGTAVSGQSVLATGLGTGHYVDGGRTTIRSRMFSLPGGGSSTLQLHYWYGFGANATSDDSFRVRLVSAAGKSVGVALTVRGDGTAHLPAWQTLTWTIPATLAGTDVAIQLEATDGGAASTVEAGVDQVIVTGP